MRTDRRNDCTRRAAALIWVLLAFWPLIPATWNDTSALRADEPPSATDKSRPTRDYWDAVYVRGGKIGYAHTVVHSEMPDAPELFRVEIDNQLHLSRFGQTNDEKLRLVSFETAAGELRRFESTVEFGPAPMIVAGEVAGRTLRLRTTTAGKVLESEIPWEPGTGGFYATELSLARQPMQPGEERVLRSLLPLMNVVGESTLRARDYESTSLTHGDYRLLRIETAVKLPGGQVLESVLWTTRGGEILKSSTQAVSQETFRVSRQEALDQADRVAFDLGYDTVVPLNRPILTSHRSRRVRYRVTMAEGDPAAVFASGITQQVASTGPHVAEILVTSRRLPATADTATASASASGGAEGAGSAVAPAEPAPTVEDVRPNSLIQSDDPQVVALAEQAVGNEADPVRMAARLEQFVHDNITQKNFSQAFATAAEVAQSREGDCTEHAVLLAALARAKKIPARVVVGLVYMSGGPGFGYHMWDEVYLTGRWVPLDATLAQQGIGAAHLKLAHSSLAGASAYSTLLPVAQVLGRLKIEVLEQE